MSQLMRLKKKLTDRDIVVFKIDNVSNMAHRAIFKRNISSRQNGRILKTIQNPATLLPEFCWS